MDKFVDEKDSSNWFTIAPIPSAALSTDVEIHAQAVDKFALQHRLAAIHGDGVSQGVGKSVEAA